MYKFSAPEHHQPSKDLVQDLMGSFLLLVLPHRKGLQKVEKGPWPLLLLPQIFCLVQLNISTYLHDGEDGIQNVRHQFTSHLQAVDLFLQIYTVYQLTQKFQLIK